MKIFTKLGCLIILIIVIIYYPKNVYAGNEIIKVDFEDKNLYNMIINQLGNQVLGKDDSRYIIDITKKDIEQIKELSLDANNLNITEFCDIDGIQSFIGLEKLEFLNYKLDNITVLKYLPNLNKLTINNCQLNNISDISELVNLKELDLGNNQIKDINPLEKLVNLEKLKLNKNQISDITPLSKLTKLIGLDLSSNQIENIKPLANLANLTLTSKEYDINVVPLQLVKIINFEYLYLDDNQINDISYINKNILQFTFAQKQKTIVKTNKKEIELPKIFNKIYAGNKLGLMNCKLNKDASKIIIQDTNKEAKIKITEGNLSESVFTVQFDANAPNLMINYINAEETKNSVVAAITSNEDIKPVKGWILSDNKRKLSKTYLKNTIEKIKIYDLAGNEANITVQAKNINMPILNISYSVINDLAVSKGEQIVAEADKYVGKVPYVLQGDSLVDGIDCSHFVYRILKLCGVYDGEYLRSTKWINVGEPVQDLEHAIAGDIIVWDGHVAIYDGKGKIIEAKGTKWGLTHDRNATNAIDKKTFLGIRRFTANEKVETAIMPEEKTNKDIKVTISSNKKIKPVKGWNLSKDEKSLTRMYNKNVNALIKINDFDDNEVEAKINITNIQK